MTQPNAPDTHKYEFVYEDIEDGYKEKVAVTLDSELPLDKKRLDFMASFYNDMYDLNQVTWREIVT